MQKLKLQENISGLRSIKSSIFRKKFKNLNIFIRFHDFLVKQQHLVVQTWNRQCDHALKQRNIHNRFQLMNF